MEREEKNRRHSMNTKILSTPLTTDLKARIYHVFGQHAMHSIGMDGLNEAPLVFALLKDGPRMQAGRVQKEPSAILDTELTEKLIGCVVVQMFWGQLHIKYLLIEEAYRGQGYARCLMERAFLYGKERGCHFAFVETMNFQAPGFYQKLGFETEFVRSGFAKGTSFHYLKKFL